jgi:glycosyltransferase involved in cell wall biosynthesis
MKWAVEHPDVMVNIAGRAKNYVTTNYDWDNITENTLRLYEKSFRSSVT